MTGDFISQGDGQSQTILFAENVQATNWGSPLTNSIGFGISVKVTASSGVPTGSKTGAFGPTTGTPNLGNALALQDTFVLTEGAAADDDATPNSNVGIATQGATPRPSSLHSGGVFNVTFADGGARPLSDQIPVGVFAMLISSDGQRHGQGVINQNDID